jgi:hypothetical protein
VPFLAPPGGILVEHWFLLRVVRFLQEEGATWEWIYSGGGPKLHSSARDLFYLASKLQTYFYREFYLLLVPSRRRAKLLGVFSFPTGRSSSSLRFGTSESKDINVLFIYCSQGAFGGL